MRETARVYTAQPPADVTAVMGRRIGAFIINFVIFLVVLIVSSRSFGDFKSEDIPAQFDHDEVCDVVTADSSVHSCFVIGDTVFYSTGTNAPAKVWGPTLLISFLNSVVLAAATGASVGKHIFGLRVVRSDTRQPAGFAKQLVRWALWLVDGFPYCFPLVGLITGLATKGHRRVGDMAANTLVVHKSSVGLLPNAAGAPMGWSPPPGGFGPPPAPGGFGGAPAPGQWAPPAPPADPWTPPAPPADPWSQPVAPPAPTWNDPIPPAADPPAPAPEAVAEPAAADPAAGGPQWDAARNAYVQYEPVAGKWMQFDDAAQEWRPLS